MKSFRLAIVIAVVFFCLCRIGTAQNVYGSTTIDIDPSSGTVTATCETDFDGALDGSYEAQVVCTVTDQNGTQIANGDNADIDGVGYTQVVLTFAGTPGSTYTATGIHHAIAVLVVQQYLKTLYEDPYNLSNSYQSEASEDYPNYYDWFGPGPEEQTKTISIRLGETWATETDPQIPTASRIVSTISSQAQGGCPAGYAGWNRSVFKIMTDQNGSDITTANQSLTEGVTINARNDLNLSTQVQTGTATTNSVGQFIDRLAFCSQACPASSGETDATQVIGLTYQGQQHTLTPNSFVYKCTGNTINGK
jgi:hypothetical protein